jgi:hypothetical protein
MIVKDPGIASVILKIADQYNNNISTRFLRPYLLGILSEMELSRQITALTEQADTVSDQGIHIDDLYDQILGMSRFVYLVRTTVLPNIRNMTVPSTTQTNKIYHEMAVNNFGANISILADLVNELYVLTVAYDKRKSPKGKLAASSISGLSEIGRYLVLK